jgi:hypothetical protein
MIRKVKQRKRRRTTAGFVQVGRKQIAGSGIFRSGFSWQQFPKQQN